MIEMKLETRPEPLAAIDEAMLVVREKAAAVRFGTITLTIHEGRHPNPR